MLMTDVFAKPELYVVQCHDPNGKVNYTSNPMTYHKAKKLQDAMNDGLEYCFVRSYNDKR